MIADDFIKYGIVVPPNLHGNAKVACPKCQHERKRHTRDTPLSVNIDEGKWKCHHCGRFGNLKYGWSDDSAAYFEKKVKQPKEYKKPESVKIVALPNEVIEYFETRKITQDVLKRNKISYGKFWFPQAQKEMNAILFPYYDGEELINVKARRNNPERMFSQSKDAKPIPYKLNDIRGQKEFGITEGETDCLSWEVAGFQNFISSPGGAINKNDKQIDGKLQFLEYIQVEVEKARWIYVATDTDEPGRRFEQELVRRVGKEKCKRIKYPEGCKDANDVLCKHGADELKKCYDNAEPYPIDGLIQFSDIADDIVKIFTDGFRRSLSTGIKTLDEIYTIREGELTVVTGVPSHGKSLLVNYFVTHLVRTEKWKFAVYSVEHHPLERFFANLAKSYIGKPFMRGPSQRMNNGELFQALATLNEYVKPIYPVTGERKLDSILALARINVYRYGIKGLVIDPWNRIEHERSGKDLADYVAATLDRIQDFARRNDIHIWIVAHPKLLQRNKEGVYHKPSLYDISGGANWRNCVDHGLIVWRDLSAQNNIVEIRAEKIKYDEIGKIASREILYDVLSGRYYDMPNHNNTNGKADILPHWNEPSYEKIYEGQQPDLPF